MLIHIGTVHTAAQLPGRQVASMHLLTTRPVPTIQTVVVVPIQALPAQQRVATATGIMPAQAMVAAGDLTTTTIARVEMAGQPAVPLPRRQPTIVIRVVMSIMHGHARAAGAAIHPLPETVGTAVAEAATSSLSQAISSHRIKAKAGVVTNSHNPAISSQATVRLAEATAPQAIVVVVEESPRVAVVVTQVADVVHASTLNYFSKKSPLIRTISGDFRFVCVVIATQLSDTN